MHLLFPPPDWDTDYILIVLFLIEARAYRPPKKGEERACKLYRAKFKWSKLSAAIYGVNKLCMPCVPAYNEIHKCIGGEVYIVLPAYNDIHGTIAFIQCF